MLKLENPISWMSADIKELHSFVTKIDTSLNEMQKAAQVMQDFGTKHVHKSMLTGGDSFNSDSFADMKKVLDGRLRMEKPELDVIFGKVPDKSSGAFARTVQKRIEFASKYKYPKDIVTAETGRLTSK